MLCVDSIEHDVAFKERTQLHLDRNGFALSFQRRHNLVNPRPRLVCTGAHERALDPPLVPALCMGLSVQRTTQGA